MVEMASPAPCPVRVKLATVIAASRMLEQLPCEPYPDAIDAANEHRKCEDEGRPGAPRNADGQPQAENRSDYCSPPTQVEVALSAHRRLPAAFYARLADRVRE